MVTRSLTECRVRICAKALAPVNVGAHVLHQNHLVPFTCTNSKKKFRQKLVSAIKRLIANYFSIVDENCIITISTIRSNDLEINQEKSAQVQMKNIKNK